MPMPDAPDFATTPLDALSQWIDSDALPPVDQWQPHHSGSIAIHIAADGRWFHEGGEITRPAMVRAFSRLLRREGDGSYALVTPAERLAITVDDAPLIAVEARVEGEGIDQTILFRLNTDAIVMLDADHPLMVRDGPAGQLPYLRVSGSAERPIEARLSRSTYYALADLADDHGHILSNGRAFPLGAPA